MGHAVCLDPVENGVGVEFSADDQGRPDRQCRQKPAVAPMVLKGALNQHHRMLHLAHEVRCDNRMHLDQVGFMRTACPLRKARTSTRELNARNASPPEHLDLGGMRVFGQVDQTRSKRRGRTHRHQGDFRVEITQHGLYFVREAFIEDEKRCIDRVRQKRDLARNQSVVQRNRHGSDTLNRQIHGHQLDAVRHQVGDLFPGGNAAIAKRAGEFRYQNIKLFVCHLDRTANRGDAFRMKASLPKKRFDDIAIFLHGCASISRTSPSWRHTPSSSCKTATPSAPWTKRPEGPCRKAN